MKTRRVSCISANEPRRETAKFMSNHIAEESSNSSDDSSKNYVKPKTDLDKRRSQEIVDPNLTSILKKSEEENVST